ncbi:uncharacterized protein LOC135694314 [Rhopilema esculentum]|uniref:uncharacterized protein LOC135694314 n=1 Tax=Rhopilema esculentum TaxID=499914 RepID=UPI0031D7884C|eukprot:gene4296-20496_t
MRRSSREEELVPMRSIEAEEGRRLPSSSSLSFSSQKDIRRKKSVRFCDSVSKLDDLQGIMQKFQHVLGDIKWLESTLESLEAPLRANGSGTEKLLLESMVDVRKLEQAIAKKSDEAVWENIRNEDMTMRCDDTELMGNLKPLISSFTMESFEAYLREMEHKRERLIASVSKLELILLEDKELREFAARRSSGAEKQVASQRLREEKDTAIASDDLSSKSSSEEWICSNDACNQSQEPSVELSTDGSDALMGESHKMEAGNAPEDGQKQVLMEVTKAKVSQAREVQAESKMPAQDFELQQSMKRKLVLELKEVLGDIFYLEARQTKLEVPYLRKVFPSKESLVESLLLLKIRAQIRLRRKEKALMQKLIREEKEKTLCQDVSPSANKGVRYLQLAYKRKLERREYLRRSVRRLELHQLPSKQAEILPTPESQEKGLLDDEKAMSVEPVCDPGQLAMPDSLETAKNGEDLLDISAVPKGEECNQDVRLRLTDFERRGTARQERMSRRNRKAKRRDKDGAPAAVQCSKIESLSSDVPFASSSVILPLNDAHELEPPCCHGPECLLQFGDFDPICTKKDPLLFVGEFRIPAEDWDAECSLSNGNAVSSALIPEVGAENGYPDDGDIVANDNAANAESGTGNGTKVAPEGTSVLDVSRNAAAGTDMVCGHDVQGSASDTGASNEGACDKEVKAAKLDSTGSVDIANGSINSCDNQMPKQQLSPDAANEETEINGLASADAELADLEDCELPRIANWADHVEENEITNNEPHVLPAVPDKDITNPDLKPP